MSASASNVVPFPLNRRPVMRGCPQCGRRSDVVPFGRLLWGYCAEHETRWVVADLKSPRERCTDRAELRRGLELLSRFVEVSH